MVNVCPWDLVAVHWTDAFDSDDPWTDIKTYEPKAQTVLSVGYLWDGCLTGHVTITTSFMPDDLPTIKTVGAITHIPDLMVISITKIVQPDINFGVADEHPHQHLR